MRRKPNAFEPVDPLNSGKQVIIGRHTTPTEGRMIDDAKHALGAQLALFRRNANLEQWDAKTASAFQKLVQSLTTIQASEKTNFESMDLGNLTSEELTRLSTQSTRVLGAYGPQKPSSGDSED